MFQMWWVVNNQTKKGLLGSRVKTFFFKSVNIWQSYKQERDCLVHFFRLLVMCWPGAQSARDNHVLACNFAKKIHRFKKNSLTDSAINLS